MKKIILSILCLTSFARADMVDSEALDQDIDEILQLLSDEDKALVEIGAKIAGVIDDSALNDDSEEALESLSRAELLALFGSTTKKKCSKCCSSCCSSCNKCKKCCCKVQSMLSQ